LSVFFLLFSSFLSNCVSFLLCYIEMSQNSLLEQLQQQPAALKTTVAITGVISLSDEDADRLEVTNQALSQTLMELSMLSNNTDMPAGERRVRLLALYDPLMTSADALLEIVTHASNELTRVPFVDEGRKVLGEVKKYRDTLCDNYKTFKQFDEGKQRDESLKYSQEISNDVLTVLEKCMELLAVPDRSTIAALDEACDTLAQSVCSIQDEFIKGQEPAQIARRFDTEPNRVTLLVNASQLFVMHMTNCLRGFCNRLPVIINEEAKKDLDDGMKMLQETAPHFLNIAQGKAPDTGDAKVIIDFLQRAKKCVREVPNFSARVLAEFVDGSALGIAAHNLATAVGQKATAEIGEKARKYALEVTSVINQCRAIGVDKNECDMAQAALAEVIRLAKIATETGDPEDFKKFKAALDYLTTMVQNLPKKFSRDLYEESTAIFDAAVSLSKSGLLDLVDGMK